MAPDAAGASVKPASVNAGRLHGPQRSGTPFSSKSTITSSPIQTRSTPRSRRYGIPADRDSDSSLSDVEPADSEAETERLHQSPQKHRPKMVVQHADNTATSVPLEASPKKDNDAKDEADDALRELSPLTRTPSKKRKRDDTGSPSVRGQREGSSDEVALPLHPKKKVHTPSPKESGLDALENDEEHIATNGNSHSDDDGGNKNDEDVTPPEANGDAQPEAEDNDAPIDTPEEGADDENVEQSAAPTGDETPDTADVVREDDEDVERALKKKQAMDDLAEIERIFAKLKDSIYNEKLRRVDFEQKLLEEGTHPEYVAQKACIDQRLEEKVRLANAQYKYGMEALETATHVSRAQIHSQYYQSARHLRETSLYECNELWYHIQRERRAGDALVPEFTYRIPDRQATRIKQRTQYNWEVGILSAVSKHVGFPAAPDVAGATEEEMAEDFEELGISTRASVRPAAHPSNLRVDEHYERPSPHHWSQTHPSPPSPAPHAGHQPHAHSHVHQHPHRPHHHHHHHRPQQQSNVPRQDQGSGPRRAPNNNLGQQPSSLPLSQLLQQSSEGGVKMEAQSSQMPLPSFKNSEQFSSFSNHYTQQQQQSLPPQRQPGFHPSSQHMQFPRDQQSQQASSQNNASGEQRAQARDHDVDPFRKSKDDSNMADAVDGGRMPFAYRNAGRGYT